MLIYIYLTRAVMSCNTLSPRKTRMTDFAETARKAVTKSLRNKQKSATGVHGASLRHDSGETRRDGKQHRET
jgi:hypothetical protein